MQPTDPEDPLALDPSLFDPLVGRLRALDLRLSSAGPHLEDERLAELATGGSVNAAEAAHLAGCDECTGLWVAVAADLEALTADAVEAAALLRSPPPRPRTQASGRGWWVAALCVAGAAAAALGLDAWRVRPAEPAPPPVTRPASTQPAATEAPTRRTVPIAPEAAAPLEPTNHTAVPTPPNLEKVAEVSSVAAESLSETVPTPTQQPRRTRHKNRRRTASATPPAPAIPNGSPMRLVAPEAHGPTRMAVDGPPRGYGHLRLNTRPAARIYVDGTSRGWTPLVDMRLPEGPHDVRLVFDSPLAADPEQRFRVIIESDRIWRAVRDNRKR